MSINSMANAAMSRRPDFEPVGNVPKGYGEITRAAGAMPPAPLGPDGQSSPPVQTALGTSLQTLTTYIPTEVLTLYVAAVAALSPVGPTTTSNVSHWVTFWCFLVATPVIVWVAFATKVKAASRAVPLSPKRWPMWEMSAATIAYAAWAFALPNSPFAQFAHSWYSQNWAGFVVLVVSFVLGGLGPLMQQPLAA
jgi:hypothetical protein